MVAESDPAPSGRHRVLVVDDDPAVLASMGALLSHRCEVETAATGEEGLAKAAAESFDVVVADYKMPGMDGVTMLRRVAALPGNVGRVLVTGMREYFREQVLGGRDRESVLHGVILKPFAPEALFSAVERAATLCRMQRAVGAARLASLRLTKDRAK